MLDDNVVKWIFFCLNKGVDNLINGLVLVWRNVFSGE